MSLINTAERITIEKINRKLWSESLSALDKNESFGTVEDFDYGPALHEAKCWS